jgi:hypothetical protein
LDANSNRITKKILEQFKKILEQFKEIVFKVYSDFARELIKHKFYDLVKLKKVSSNFTLDVLQ